MQQVTDIEDAGVKEDEGLVSKPHDPFCRGCSADVAVGNTPEEMVAAAIRTIFAQPDAEHVHEQFEVIATMLGKQLPKVEQMLREAHDDLVAFTGFPVSHWKKIWSTNPLERLNKEVKRRTDPEVATPELMTA
jgi:putative transposase